MDGLLPARGQLVLTDLHGDFGIGGGGARLQTSFSQGCASVVYQDFAPKLDLHLIYRLSDLVNCFELLCGFGGYDVSSICSPRVYLTGAYYHRPCLIWGHWVSQVFTLMCLEQFCCREVIRCVLFCTCIVLMMSDDRGDGDWFPVATTVNSRTGGSRCCG